jgi:hypothetical protein
MLDLLFHLLIIMIFIMEALQHWYHHRKNKNNRQEPRYTLDEARVLLFDEAVRHTPRKPDLTILHDVAKVL